MKKFLAGLLCLSLILVNGVFVSANSETPSNYDEIWNYRLIDPGTEGLYSEFPMIIDKTIRKDMRMDLQLKYVKNIGLDDTITVTISDVASDSIVVDETLTTTDCTVVFENAPNAQVYKVTINETLNGISSEYIGYIETKYVPTDFPANIMLGNTAINNNRGEVISNIKIKKIGDNPQCLHDEDEPCTEACSISNYISEITPDEFDTFYSGLDANSFYELQMDVSDGGKSTFYQGFISTYENGEDEGIFTRGFSFSKELPGIRPNSVANAAAAATPDFSDAYEYEFYQNEYINTLGYSDEYIIKFIAPETGDYTIETIGNADTMFWVYYEYDGVIEQSFDTCQDGGTGENAMTNIGLLVNEENRPTLYIVLILQDGEPAPCAFRIIRDDYVYSDDFPNYRDEVQADCEAGNYSEPFNPDCRIDYNGDVDIFGYDVNAGDGYIKFENVDNAVSLEADVFVAYPDTPFDTCWKEDTVTPSSKPSEITFSEDRYYIEVKQAQSDLPDFGDESDGYYDEYDFYYDFKFYDPKQMDEVDLDTDSTYGNNTPVTPTEISLPYTNSKLTLHKGDSDYIKFTTDQNGGDITITVTITEDKKQYIPLLYDYNEVEIISSNPPQWKMPDELSEAVESDDNMKIEYEGLLPKHEYLVKVERPDSNTYSSYHQYKLDIDISIPDVPSAVLNGDVELTHTVGEDITSLDDFLDIIMGSMTCSINGSPVSDSVAIDDVVLYYNNKELTASMVNVMGEGTYTIVPKYQGVAATGGTVTLIVSESGSSSDTTIELDTVTNENVANSVWDWAAAARMVANSRLQREGSELTTKSVPEAILAIKPSALTTRGTLEETAQAANFFYTDGTAEGFNFVSSSIDISTAESTLFNSLEQGKAVVMLLTSESEPDNMAKARYVVLCGINTSEHTYKIMDPVLSGNDGDWVSQDVIHNGGYNGNDDLIFTGMVIEFI